MSNVSNPPSMLAVFQGQFPALFPALGGTPRVPQPCRAAAGGQPTVQQPPPVTNAPIPAAQAVQQGGAPMEEEPVVVQQGQGQGPGQGYANAVAAGNVGNKGPSSNQPGANLAGTAGGQPSAKNDALQTMFMDTWGPIANDMHQFGQGLRATIDGQTATPAELTTLSSYNKLEKGVETLAHLLLFAFTALDTVVPTVSNNQDMVTKNVLGGNLSLDLENSDKYKKVQRDLTRSDVETKVIELDFEEKLTSKDAIVKKAKAKLGKTNHLAKVIKHLHVEPLARETKPSKEKKDSNGQPINTVPVIITSKNKRDKIALDKSLRKAEIITAFHWPSEIVQPMKDIRDIYQGLKIKDGVDLTDKYLLIRPNTDTGKSINIFYRSKEKGSKFQYLESIKTPASYDLCAQLNQPQPSVSKFCTLFQ